MSITKSTIVVYPYSSGTRELTVPFDYLKREFVVVSLGGMNKQQKALKLGTDYRFTTKTTISITRQYQQDEGYDKVIVRRVTDASKRIVNYQDGSILNASELNISQLQSLHVAEEARDLANYTLFVNDENNLDARERRIINLADPINPQDAVTKKYVDTASESVIDSRNKALQYRNEAETFKNQAQGFRNEAETFKNTAEQKATEISSKIDKADTLNEQAIVNSNKAQQYATSAQQSASTASQAEKNAQASDKSAAKSAEEAKRFANSLNTQFLTTKVDTIEALKGFACVQNDVIVVLGYHDKTDGATHIRTISNKDNGSGIRLNNGLYANLSDKDPFRITWWGAKGDGSTDNSAILNKAFAYAKDRRLTVLVPKGTFVVDAPIDIKGVNSMSIVGESRRNSIFKKTTATTSSLVVGRLLFNEPVIFNFAPYGDTSGCYDLYVENIELKTSEVSAGICAHRLARSTFNKVGHQSSGKFFFKTLEGSWALLFKECVLYSLDKKFIIKDMPYFKLENSLISGGGSTTGIEATDCSVSVLNSHIDSQAPCVKLEGSSSLVLSGSSFESRYGVEAHGDNSSIRIKNCHLALSVHESVKNSELWIIKLSGSNCTLSSDDTEYALYDFRDDKKPPIVNKYLYIGYPTTVGYFNNNIYTGNTEKVLGNKEIALRERAKVTFENNGIVTEVVNKDPSDIFLENKKIFNFSKPTTTNTKLFRLKNPLKYGDGIAATVKLKYFTTYATNYKGLLGKAEYRINCSRKDGSPIYECNETFNDAIGFPSGTSVSSKVDLVVAMSHDGLLEVSSKSESDFGEITYAIEIYWLGFAGGTKSDNTFILS